MRNIPKHSCNPDMAYMVNKISTKSRAHAWGVDSLATIFDDALLIVPVGAYYEQSLLKAVPEYGGRRTRGDELLLGRND